MSNLIKMELYKLRTSKLFSALLCICAVVNAVFAAVTPLLVKAFSNESLTVDLSSAFANPFSMDLLMVFLFVSAVSFFYLDFSDGYIKNIAGQAPNRRSIVFSKLFAVAVHNLIFFIVVALSSILGSAIVGALTVDENIAAGIMTLLIKWLLSIGLCSILMFFAVGLRSKTIATVLSVVFPIGALSLLYMGIDNLLRNVLKVSEDFSLSYFMPDSLISSVNAIKDDLVVNSVVAAVVCIVLFYILTIIVFKKRDIK